ncbi:unnamed protein product [Vitrella brassicaformis CCMP3155]|uniref:Protein kinase domain-containing protein n=1 Tax=Vitrella brassicaformis (strain CCMP3155) TaxID=1169540 RepID=A0A0G4GUW8_VITBC|nr:unnamed protein product [Vitrella brassicaformis CCMP3155]|eukprot:CEM34416.1 unnamed protein product [Vitrella brassicaformis CCMP3155]
MCPELLFPCPYCTPVKRMPETLLALPLAEETVALGMGLVEDEAYTCVGLVCLRARQDPYGVTAAPIGAHAPPVMPALPHMMQQPFQHPPPIAASGAPAAHAPGWGFVPLAAAMAPHRAPQTSAAPQHDAVRVRPNIAAISMATPAVPAAPKARAGEGRDTERREEAEVIEEDGCRAPSATSHQEGDERERREEAEVIDEEVIHERQQEERARDDEGHPETDGHEPPAAAPTLAAQQVDQRQQEGDEERERAEDVKEEQRPKEAGPPPPPPGPQLPSPPPPSPGQQQQYHNTVPRADNETAIMSADGKAFLDSFVSYGKYATAMNENYHVVRGVARGTLGPSYMLKAPPPQEPGGPAIAPTDGAEHHVSPSHAYQIGLVAGRKGRPQKFPVKLLPLHRQQWKLQGGPQPPGDGQRTTTKAEGTVLVMDHIGFLSGAEVRRLREEGGGSGGKGDVVVGAVSLRDLYDARAGNDDEDEHRNELIKTLAATLARLGVEAAHHRQHVLYLLRLLLRIHKCGWVPGDANPNNFLAQWDASSSTIRSVAIDFEYAVTTHAAQQPRRVMAVDTFDILPVFASYTDPAA